MTNGQNVKIRFNQLFLQPLAKPLATSDIRIADIEELAHHKYQVLEDCLFYKLSQEADKMQGKGNALMLLPPTLAAGETLDVEVLNVVVRQMWMVLYCSVQSLALSSQYDKHRISRP